LSSVNEVIVSGSAIFGSDTYVPLPWRRSSRPSRTSSSIAARSVGRETPSSDASRRSGGIASPTVSSSSSDSSSSHTSECLLPRPLP
jgi:hypothetical protein